jgi:hypothetical protein
MIVKLRHQEHQYSDLTYEQPYAFPSLLQAIAFDTRNGNVTITVVPTPT